MLKVVKISHINKFVIFLIVFSSILKENVCHLTKHENSSIIEQISAKQNQNDVRNLLQVEQQIFYVLKISGLKEVGLFIYAMGIRVVGMQNLLIWQIIHLYQQSQQKTSRLYFQIGDYIHGYTNPDIFTLLGFGYGFIFQKLNLMWEVGTFLFCIGAIGRFVLGPWFKSKATQDLQKRSKKKKQIKVQVVQYQNQTQFNLINKQPLYYNPNICPVINFTQPQMKNQVKNNNELFPKVENSNEQKHDSRKSSFNHRDSLIKTKMMGISSLETCDGSNLRTQLNKVREIQLFLQNKIGQQRKTQNQQNCKNEIIYQSKIQQGKIHEKVQAAQQKALVGSNLGKVTQNKQSMKEHYRYFKTIERYSNIILKQIVFNIVVNSLTISSYGLMKEIMYPSIQQQSHSLSFSGGFILISQALMLLITLSLVLKRQVGSGENRGKFRVMSYGNVGYWSISILQRIVYGLVLATKWRYSIVVVGLVKLCVLILSKFFNFWRQQGHYYRYLCLNFVHFLAIMILVLDQFYLRIMNDQLNETKLSIAWILLGLLVISFVINFCFIVKESCVIRWIKNVFGFSSTVTNLNAIQHPENKIISSNPQQILSDNQNQSDKRVKFNTKKQIIPQKSSKNTQKTLKNSQIQFQQSVQEKQFKKPVKLSTEPIPIKSESLIKTKKPKRINEKQTPKIYAKTQKNINIEINDALRAQKSKHLIIQQTHEKEQFDQDEAQIVSIQLNNQNSENQTNHPF